MVNALTLRGETDPVDGPGVRTGTGTGREATRRRQMAPASI